MNTPRSQAGFGIVEVMVALVVLAVGMLGIASLYVTTLQSSSTAISRMQAVSLAGDLADRIRANRRVGATYGKTGAEEKKDCIGATDCSPEDMAKNDLYLWQKQIDDLLPGSDPKGVVTYTAGTGTDPDKYTIKVNWDEPNRSTSADAPKTLPFNYTLTMQIEP